MFSVFATHSSQTNSVYAFFMPTITPTKYENPAFLKLEIQQKEDKGIKRRLLYGQYADV